MRFIFLLMVLCSQRSSFMLKFTEVLKYHKLRCSRKFVQTFANGLVVYTYHPQFPPSPPPSYVFYYFTLILSHFSIFILTYITVILSPFSRSVIP